MDDLHDVERERLRLGSYIVAGAIVAAVLSLVILMMADKQNPSSLADKVALLGSITTFLGLVVGVFFGVNASGSAHAQNTAAAIETSQAAGTVADAARSVTDTARAMSDTASRSLDAAHAMVARGMTGTAPGLDRSGGGGPGDAGGAVESLSGDPDDTATNLVIPSARGEASDTFARTAIHIASPIAPQVLFGQRVLAAAAAEADAHVSRDSNRARVTEYLALLGFPFADSAGVPTRYCAAGLCWAVCKAYCDSNGIQYSDATRLAMLRSVLGDVGKYYFKPSAGCQVIMDDARARNTFVSKSETPQPGYLVFFNWSGLQHAEHIGIVEQPGAGVLHTIEFNTTAMDGPNQGNGGAVSRKDRAMKFVLGYAATYR